MRFADPHVCPDCRGVISGNDTCPHCGLDLTSVEVRQLWQTLLQADDLLVRARRLDRAPGSGAPITLDAATLPAYDSAVSSPPPRRSVSTGSVLLGLGAMFLLVSGAIFITVSWGSLGVAGRALVLLAFTVLVGGVAQWATRRQLPGSAEALWTVFLGLFTLDWFAAWNQGLFNLDAVPFAVIALVWSVAAFGAGAWIVDRGRRPLGRQLIAPMVVAGAAPWVGAGAIVGPLVDDWGWTHFWASTAASALALAFLVAAVRLRLTVTAALLGVLTALASAVVIVVAAIEAGDSPSARELVVDLHGLPLLLVVVAAVVAGLLTPRVTVAAASLATLGVALLIVLPIEAAWTDRGAYVTVSVLVVLLAVAARGAGRWTLGVRISDALLAAGLALASLPWIANLLDTMGTGAEGVGDQPFGDRSTAMADLPGPWWVALVVFAALTIAGFLMLLWPELVSRRDTSTPVVAGVGAVGVLSVVAAAEAPFVVLALVGVAVGAILAFLLAERHLAWSLAGPALVALAPVVPLTSRSATVLVWLSAAAVLATIAASSDRSGRRDPSAFAAVAWGLGSAGMIASLAEAETRIVALSLVAAAVVGVAVASFALRTRAGRVAVEAATALVAAVGLVLAAATDLTLSWQALLWTLVGASLVLLGLAIRDRRLFGVLGSVALGVAYVLRLLASDVEIVEAYTLPFAAVLLAGGLLAMRGAHPRPSVQALLPGVVLALVPSLPQALDSPTSLRALLLGLGALATFAVGARWHWKVPFLAGATVLVLIVVVNVGPYALALPRWSLIAIAGTLLIGSGVTWEDRVRDGRAVVKYVGTMG